MAARETRDVCSGPGQPCVGGLGGDRANAPWVIDNAEHHTRMGKVSGAVVLDNDPRLVVGSAHRPVTDRGTDV